MFVIYSEKESSRLSYVLQYIFGDLCGVDFLLTTDIDTYKSTEGLKINYSARRMSGEEFYIEACPILFDSNLNPCKVGVADFEGTKALFPQKETTDFSFDIFSAVFYMLSRYEEYQPYIKDAHGRFKPTESLAYKHGFLNKPVVNIWVNHFIRSLEAKYKQDLNLKTPRYSFVNTIDIDIAYSFAHKGLYRNFFGYVRALLYGRFDEILQRSKVLGGALRDPFDNYDFIIDTLQKYRLNTIFFVHVGDYGIYDKNVPYKNNKFRDLIRHLADYAEIGIHPSYESSTREDKLQEEIERLSEIIRKDITKSRQHFLRLSFPQTYRQLINNKIREDFSLGFASEIGFRAGVCTPFRFFDLDTNKATSLIIRPFSLMEGTLKDYLNKNINESMGIIESQIREVRDAGGEFISLWHNESLGNEGRWEGWKEVYEKMIQWAV